MLPRIRKLIAVTLLCAIPLAVAGCAEWKGSPNVNTDVGGGAEGHGPGLFTGKEGAIILYNGPWFGAAPDGGEAE